MRSLLAISLFTVSVLSASPTWAVDSCSAAYGRCLQVRTGVCDAQCKSYCAGERKRCMSTGSFNTRNHSWSGLKRS